LCPVAAVDGDSPQRLTARRGRRGGAVGAAGFAHVWRGRAFFRERRTRVRSMHTARAFALAG